MSRLNTKRVQLLLRNYLSKKKDFLVLSENISWSVLFEMDAIMITKDWHIYEYEIKTSRGDFLKDKQKKVNGILKTDFIKGDVKSSDYYNESRPNKFYYVAPQGLIKKHEIEPEYGLIEILESGQVINTKHAKLIHDNEVSMWYTISIARNFCLKMSRL
jgi:hypothetical protein